VILSILVISSTAVVAVVSKRNCDPDVACLLLQPHHDTDAGTVDTWPAHVSVRGSSAQSKHFIRNKHIAADENFNVNSANMQLTSKPKFLEQLEVFLERELRCLGVSSADPSDARLQVHSSFSGSGYPVVVFCCTVLISPLKFVE